MGVIITLLVWLHSLGDIGDRAGEPWFLYFSSDVVAIALILDLISIASVVDWLSIIFTFVPLKLVSRFGVHFIEFIASILYLILIALVISFIMDATFVLNNVPVVFVRFKSVAVLWDLFVNELGGWVVALVLLVIVGFILIRRVLIPILSLSFLFFL